jgi:hypothetical protein
VVDGNVTSSVLAIIPSNNAVFYVKHVKKRDCLGDLGVDVKKRDCLGDLGVDVKYVKYYN